MDSTFSRCCASHENSGHRHSHCRVVSTPNVVYNNLIWACHKPVWVSSLRKCVLSLNVAWKVPESLRYRMCEWLPMLNLGQIEKGWRSEIFLAEVQATLTGTLMASLSNCPTSVGERVHQFSPLLAVLFFCSCVCNGVNSWTPLLLTLSLMCFLSLLFSFSLSFSLLPSLCLPHSAKLRQLVLALVCLTKCLQTSND